MVARQSLEKYLWLPDRYKLYTPDPADNDRIFDHDEIVRKKIANRENLPSEYSLRMQQIVDQYSLKVPINTYRLCLFYDLVKSNCFEDPQVVSSTISVPFCKQLLVSWKKLFPDMPKPIIAKLSIQKGMHGFSPGQVTSKNKREGEFILGIDCAFCATTNLYSETVDGKSYQFVNFSVSFAVMEETYQKFKNRKHVTHEMLLNYEKKIKPKRFN